MSTYTSLLWSTHISRVRTHQTRSYFMVHRADFTKILTERALELGVTIHFKAKIASILDEQDHVTVKIEDNTTFTSDILIGADGTCPYTLFPVHHTQNLTPTQESTPSPAAPSSPTSPPTSPPVP